MSVENILEIEFMSVEDRERRYTNVIDLQILSTTFVMENMSLPNTTGPGP